MRSPLVSRRIWAAAAALVVTMAIVGSTAAAPAPPQPPIINLSPSVQFLNPANGQVFVEEVCPTPPCTAEIPFEIQVTGNGISIEELRIEIGGFVQPICSPDDPIESGDTSCPGAAPDYGFTVEKIIAVRAGDWNVKAIARNSLGATGSAEIQVRVLPSSVPRPGPVSITRVEPTAGAMAVQVRGSGHAAGEKWTARTRVRILGANLHNNPYLDIFLSPLGPSPDPVYSPEGGLPVAQWNRIPVTILSRGTTFAGESFVDVELPVLPERVRWSTLHDNTVSTLTTGWRWVVRDRWIRPERTHADLAIPDPFKPLSTREPPFTITQPAYPKIYGFGFVNERAAPSLDEFLAVYGNNAYLCVGALGYCLTRIPDPLYWGLWYPVFSAWISDTTGSCVGMASTSQLFSDRTLRAADFDPNVYFPAGFPEHGPSVFESGPAESLAGPPSPRSLWATIRTNHGVQTSAEYIHAFIDDSRLGGLSVDGDPVTRLNELRTNPQGQILCMNRSGGGHCVVAYAVTGNQIQIHDNNAPEATNLYIQVDPASNTYSYGTSWSGNGLRTIPLSIWKGSRSMPGLSDAGDYLAMLVFGAADELITTESGGRWGWLADGTFVDALPGAVALPPAGSKLPPRVRRNMPVMIPVSAGAPRLKINARGGDYLFHTAVGGQLLQASVSAPAGSAQKFSLAYEGSRLSGFDFSPDGDGLTFVPRLGMILGDREHVVVSYTGLAVQSGGTVGFRALPEQKAVEFQNGSGAKVSFMVHLQGADGLSGKRIESRFGPFEVPDGVTQQIDISGFLLGRIIEERKEAESEPADEPLPGLIPCGTVFPDVLSTHAGCLAIELVAGRGIVTGYPDGQFKPDRGLTRGEFAKMLVLAAGRKPQSGKAPGFSDTAGHWAARDGYIQTAVEMGAINGFPDGTFGPNGPLTRAQVIKVVAAAAGLTPAGRPPYRDVRAEDWFAGWTTAALHGRLIGTEAPYPLWTETTLQGDLPVTRAEAAMILANFLAAKP